MGALPPLVNFSICLPLEDWVLIYGGEAHLHLHWGYGPKSFWAWVQEACFAMLFRFGAQHCPYHRANLLFQLLVFGILILFKIIEITTKVLLATFQCDDCITKKVETVTLLP